MKERKPWRQPSEDPWATWASNRQIISAPRPIRLRHPNRLRVLARAVRGQMPRWSRA